METLNTLALSFLKRLSSAQALKCYQNYGSASAVIADKSPNEPKLRQALAFLPEALKRAGQELEFCRKSNIRVLCLNDEAYPARLRECPDAPLVLYYRGTADLNAKRIISIVGTRRITEQGKDLCMHLCRDLARLVPEAVIVSGLAYGVDINAHRGALKEGLQTIGVLAHGMDRIYPSSHRQTAAQMLSQGGLLTEYPSETNPDKGNFVQRNRIVAGMADATIVVESAKKGGALITAQLAQDYNRDVFAFPGRITDKYSEGCNLLIRDNRAALITCAEDVALAMGWATKETLKGEPVQQELFPDLKPEERALVELISETENVSISQLARTIEMTFSQLNTLLLSLETRGLIRALPGGIYRAVR